MHQHSNTDGLSHDALIMACSDAVRSLAWGFVRSAVASAVVEVDDMYSIGMLAVCEAAAVGALAADPVPYLVKCAKYAMVDEWRRLHGWSIVSLDAPLSDTEGSFTLHDVLPAPSLVPAPARSSRRAQALHGALRRLPSRRQRAVLRRRYGLVGYGEHSRSEVAASLRTTPAAAGSAALRGVRGLAADARLRVVVGVQA